MWKIQFNLLSLFILLLPFCQSKITCDVETYVLSGVEFSQCNQEAMDSFPASPLNLNPCPVLKHLVNFCSEVMRPCYDERGFLRSRQSFLEVLALQYPDKNECDVFSQHDDPNLPQQLSGEKCSINDEVVLMHDIKTCSSEAQSAVLTKLMSSNPSNQDSVEHKKSFTDIICQGLHNVSDTCFVNKLKECYTEEDSQFHLAFLLEELRLTGITLVSHLSTSHSSDGDSEAMSDVVNVDNCPVFKNGPLSLYISHRTNQNQNSDSKSSILLAVLLTLLVAFMLAVVGYFIIFKSRLVPRIRARFENTPYTDFEPSRHENQHVNELAESQARQSLPESAASFSKAACNQNISLVVTNETASASIGPGT